MIRLGLIGGRGYVGEEFLRLAGTIDDFHVVYAGSSSWAGQRVNEVFEGCDCEDLVFSNLNEESILGTQADAWVIAQPNGSAEQYVQLFSDQRTKIVDISSDYRFDNRWTYGLPERSSAEIQAASRVANPGCYATAGQLALIPIADRIEGVPQIFGISGYSGAGRKPNEKNDPDRLAGNIIPYSLTGHTHEREISQHLGIEVQFMPHVASFFRGLSLTISVQLNDQCSSQELLLAFQNYFEPQPLVKVIADVPEISSVINTNQCILGGFVVDQRDPHRVVIVSVIDNLRKGAASQVIQNLNLMFGRPSTKGLLS